MASTRPTTLTDGHHGAEFGTISAESTASEIDESMTTQVKSVPSDRKSLE
jgi:hypothetical protein